MKKLRIIVLLFIGFLLVGCSQKSTNENKKAFYSQNTSSDTTANSDKQSSGSKSSNQTDSTTENSGQTDQTAGGSDGKIEVLKTSNGDFKISIPSGWEKAQEKELSNDADIQLKSSASDSYYLVLSEKKTDFDNFSSYKNSIDLSELGDKKEETTTEVDYNGFKGERRTFVATKDNVDVYYIYDVLEGKEYYVQCISWTPNDQKLSNEQQMFDVMNSLAEL